MTNITDIKKLLENYEKIREVYEHYKLLNVGKKYEQFNFNIIRQVVHHLQEQVDFENCFSDSMFLTVAAICIPDFPN